ncbi:LemA family protein [Varibaculum vaginae]|uniref:LemA family protein n=1 Tax=Varibaculum vaginae TaxID=2364797 RepID=UPI001F19AA2C|nr:LemA family protein [Varibaculum vaginae]
MIIAESKKNVDIALAKRYDTISEMLKVAKSFARHEKTTFSDLVQLRTGVSIKDFNKVIESQEQVLGRIYALAEAYPQLRSSDEFVNLQNQIDDENEQLAAAKRIVNNNISIFNQDVVSFPISIVASMKGLRQMDFLAESHVDSKGDIDRFDYEV